MTNTLERTQPKPEYAGGMEFRFFEMDITNYDDDAAGDGEPFGAAEAGMSRLQHVDVVVNPGATSGATTQVDAVAQYDWANNAIRLFYAGTDGGSLSEVSSNVDEGAVVRIKAIGR